MRSLTFLAPSSSFCLTTLEDSSFFHALHHQLLPEHSLASLWWLEPYQSPHGPLRKLSLRFWRSVCPFAIAGCLTCSSFWLIAGLHAGGSSDSSRYKPEHH